MKVISDDRGDIGGTFPAVHPSVPSLGLPLSPPPEANSFPGQPVQSQPVLKASESLESLPVLPGRPRELGVPERIIPLGPSPSLPLTLARLQQQSQGTEGKGRA